MTFRRRVLVATLLAGGSLWCLQPMLRYRMQSRMEELLGTKVEIGQSKISFMDGTIALSNIRIYPKATADGFGKPTEVSHAALRFDWPSLLYRNFKVDACVASGIDWTMTDPSPSQVPLVRFTAPVLNSESSSLQSRLPLEPVMEPMRRLVMDESLQQSRIHSEVATRVQSILQRLNELSTESGGVNVLRHKPLVEDAKRELTIVKQSIAEDRLRHKEKAKTLQTLKDAAPKNLHTQIQSPELAMGGDSQQSLALAKYIVAQQWNRTRPVVAASVQALTTLAPDSIASEPTDLQKANMVALELPNGFTWVANAKLRGKLDAPKTLFDQLVEGPVFQMNLKNLSNHSKLSCDRSLEFEIKNEAEASSLWTCSVHETAIPQSKQTQLHMTLQQPCSGRELRKFQVSQANQGWSCSMELPMSDCESAIGSLMNASPQAMTKGSGKTLSAQLIARTTPDDPSDEEQVVIEVKPESLASISAMIAEAQKSRNESMVSKFKAECSESLHHELIKIGNRWDQLGDEHTRAHQNWERDLTTISTQMQHLELIFKRTSRNASPLIK